MVKNNGKDMLSHYGIIPIEVVRTAAKGYLTQDEDGEPEVSMKAQLSSQMLTCIQASITDECALKEATRGDSYKVEIENGDSKELIPDGPPYLKNHYRLEIYCILHLQ